MPDWIEHLRPRLAQLRLSPAREAEIIEELSQHLDERYDELRGAGNSAAEAHRLAIEELLEPEALAEYMRPLRQASSPQPIAPGAPGTFLLRGLWQDLRYAARMLRKQPGFAVAALLTLALGIGANSAIFALVDATLLRPLPLTDPERLVLVWERTETSSRERVAPPNLNDWSARSRTFDRMGAFIPNVGGMVMSGADGTAETVSRQWVTAGIFDTLGIPPVAGRTFLPSEDTQRLMMVVLGESFWRARFNADLGVVGSDIRLDGERWTIIGVVPDEAALIGRANIWALGSIQGAPPQARRSHFLVTVGRLKSGVSNEAAGADMAAVAEGLAQEFPDTNQGRGVALEPLRDAAIGGELRRTSLLFLGVVGFVLLICCANVANLLLTRATARTRELAIRFALGASRRRIIRQLLVESVLLAMIGGVLGLAVGAAILQAAPAVIPEDLLPRAVTLSFDLRVAVFCGAAALLVGLLFGLAPAWQASEIASAQALASDSRTATRRGGRLRGVLVAGEVATAVLLLFGAGLLLRTLLAVESIDRGYQAESVLTMVVDPLGSRYPTDEETLRFYEAVEQEIVALPGVQGAAWATTLPLGRSYQGPSYFEIVGDLPPAENQRPAADYQVVSSSYFSALDLPVVSGRGFDARDARGTVPVCIVNEAFVRGHLQGRSPVGVRVAIRPAESPEAAPEVREIVGVARQVKGRPDEAEELVQIYVPLTQNTPGDIFLVVRPASGQADSLIPPVRAAIGRIDKEQLVSVRDVMTLEEIAWGATSRHRFRAVLVVAFAALALVLAMVGMFGMIAYSVQQRVREFGVRRALGATTGDVLRLVAGGTLQTIGAGAIAGLALSTVSGRLLANMLFGVEPLDLTTFAWVAVVLALTAAASIAGPAWRASRVDPAVALRTE
jgi:putative ABC transport system permease protein